MDAAFLATLNHADHHDTGYLVGDHKFATNNPICVLQFMPGMLSPAGWLGDPAMINLTPIEQYRTRHVFSTLDGTCPGCPNPQFAEHHATIYCNDLDVATFALDGVAVGGAAFSAIPGSGFSVANISLTPGTHTTTSVNPHAVTVEGYNTFDSYGHPAGALQPQVSNIQSSNCGHVDVLTSDPTYIGSHWGAQVTHFAGPATFSVLRLRSAILPGCGVPSPNGRILVGGSALANLPAAIGCPVPTNVTNFSALIPDSLLLVGLVWHAQALTGGSGAVKLSNAVSGSILQ